jgi:protein involved in polysaccharide export with SLBB domain
MQKRKSAMNDRQKPAAVAAWINRVPVVAAAFLVCAALDGCAALSNPVADGVPVDRLPPEIIGKRREEEKTIPLTLLRQKPPKVYLLGPGDVLGLYIEGILGDRTQPPPVRFTELGNLPPSFGFPIPVREDGTLPLPLIDPIKVTGLSIADAQKEILKAYTVTKKILQPNRERIVVTLMRKRQYHVLVVRQDSGGLTVGPAGGLGQTKRGTGYTVDLPAYENDVLNALARTGGLSGLDAENEVTIERGYFEDTAKPEALIKEINRLPPGIKPSSVASLGGKRIRIPLRMRPDEPPPFRPEDVVLQTGDILFIEARDTELFYTGGLLPARQMVLPRDYDLDVVQAIALVQGPFVNGGFNVNNLSGNLLASGLGSPSPSLVTILRKTAGGGQIPIKIDLNLALRDPRERVLIQAGDVIILQESVNEAIIRYVTSIFHINLLGTFANHRDFIGTATVVAP